MAHSLSRGLVLAAAVLAVVVALGMQSDGRGDMRRTPIEREGEVVDLSRVSLDLGEGVTMDFVLIPAGRFLDPEKGDARVLRGGSWYSYARFCCSADRLRFAPGYRDGGIGFRVAFRLD